MYVVPKIELDETMREIKELALQIRNKKAIIRDETRVNKQSNKPIMPRTAGSKVRDRSVSRLRSEMENLGVDMQGTDDANFTKTKPRSRSMTPAAKRMRTDTESRSKSRGRSLSATPRDEQGVKDVAVSTGVACKTTSKIVFPDAEEAEERRAQGDREEGQEAGSEGRGGSFHRDEDAEAPLLREAGNREDRKALGVTFCIFMRRIQINDRNCTDRWL